jgi:hypothetical protein
LDDGSIALSTTLDPLAVDAWGAGGGEAALVSMLAKVSPRVLVDGSVDGSDA